MHTESVSLAKSSIQAKPLAPDSKQIGEGFTPLSKHQWLITKASKYSARINSSISRKCKGPLRKLQTNRNNTNDYVHGAQSTVHLLIEIIAELNDLTASFTTISKKQHID